MPGPKNPQKRKIIHHLVRPRRLSPNRITRQLLGLEGRLAGKGHRLGGREPAVPIADPVRVAGPDDGGHAAFDDVGELGEEGARVVPRGGEFLVGCVGAFLVGGLGADGFDDGGLG